MSLSPSRWRLPPLLPVALLALSIFYIWYNLSKPVGVISLTNNAIGGDEKSCTEKAQQGPSAESDIATRKRRIFIDLGANDGQSLDFLVKWKEREGKVRRLL